MGNVLAVAVVGVVSTISTLITAIISSPRRQNSTVTAIDTSLKEAEAKAKTEELKKELKKAQDAWFQGIPPDKMPDEEQVKRPSLCSKTLMAFFTISLLLDIL
ncbi:8047_t:CDS:1, partial [Paraglomus brasilianum]